MLALLGCAALGALFWWHDRREPDEWARLLSPAASIAYESLRDYFTLEERAVRSSFNAATRAETREDALHLLGVGIDYLVALAPERIKLLRRFELYARILGAVAPEPARFKIRLALLRRAFATLEREGRRREVAWEHLLDDFHELDSRLLEACRELFLALSRLDETQGGADSRA